jgi:hypothetical protein
VAFFDLVDDEEEKPAAPFDHPVDVIGTRRVPLLPLPHEIVVHRRQLKPADDSRPEIRTPFGLLDPGSLRRAGARLVAWREHRRRVRSRERRQRWNRWQRTRINASHFFDVDARRDGYRVWSGSNTARGLRAACQEQKNDERC